MPQRATTGDLVPTTSMVRRWVGNSKNWLTEFLNDATTSPEVVSVVAMGSAIRERGHRRSDFDLLVLYSGNRRSFNAPLEVDIRAYPIEKIEEKIAKGHEIIGWAIKFGIKIFDRDDAWQNLQTSWLPRLPLPSFAEALTRAHKSLSMAEEMIDSGDDSAAEDLTLAAITQFARAILIKSDVYPASRPELPGQLQSVSKGHEIATLLEEAMFDDGPVEDLVDRIKKAVDQESLLHLPPRSKTSTLRDHK